MAALCVVCSADPKPGVVAGPLAYAAAAPLAYTSPYAASAPLVYTGQVAAPLAYPAPALAAYTAPIAHSSYAVNQVHSVAAAPFAVAQPGHFAYTAASPLLLK